MRILPVGRRWVPAALLLLAIPLPCLAAPAAKEPVTVVVLPFSYLNSRPSKHPTDAKYAFLGNGFAETLTAALAQVRSLRVLERRGRGTPAEQARQGARLVVLGSFMRRGSEMRVECRLVDAANGKVDTKHSVSVKRTVDNEEAAFALEEELAIRLLRTFGVTPTEGERLRIRQAARRGAAAQTRSTSLSAPQKEPSCE